MSLNGKEFIEHFEAYCPQWLAEPGDPVGLHIGTLNKEVNRIMVTLDVRPEVVAEAVEKQVDLIIAKHPPIFRAVKRLDTDDPQTKMYADLLKHDIAVFAAHTNMDIIDNGLNDWFCELLEIENTTYLTKTHTVGYKKLAVFVPVEAAPQMRQALGQVGAGSQGDYQNTSYSLIGTGRFTPLEGADPTIGRIGQEEAVQEAKIEVIFPETIQADVIEAMLKAHPYEEPAYDVYTIENMTKEFGLGRVGELPKAMIFSEFVEKVKHVFDLEGLRIVCADEEQMIQRVAICGGSGEKFFRDAIKKQADVYITGDVYYHTGHDMLTEELAVIDPGHYIEQLCKPKLVELFNQWKKAYNWDVTFIESQVDTNPFQFR
ncbi:MULTISPECIES: Nif3-like dinuclear metal center hexameric protein [unclassified Enterococcus]|uniref:Nif3-like dinuclear metal center hexameric protein n=1 Tax=unclassified Enterococcus TaxID=2608891 RepID=UPI001CE0F628|nr:MULTISPECIES: Nif3-like dinuclear metal center hexameric protein [unclassified Enterococcus]MCA5013379.1 Nif3-like dinuclear metal center hexameric protein [Enterococcus sp. S23]MCA5016629.1 Nif3-like dinuclear metal center hexameric protein [Enterococcus sp. S22(2020)]